MPKFRDYSDIQEIERRMGGGSPQSTDYSTLSNKPKINGIELLGNKTANDLDLIGKLGNEAVSGQPYHFTYYYEQAVAADKITVKAHTITLDNNKSLNTFNLDVLPATSTTAGLLSAADKVKYDAYDGKIAAIKTLKAMKNEWLTGTTEQAANRMFDDGVQVGDGYLGDVEWSDLPGGMYNAECKAFVISDGIVQFELTSSNISPYAWFYNSMAGEWRSYVPVVDNLTSNSSVEALSAKQGKVLSEGKLNTLLNAPDGGSYRLPYYFKTTAAADKVTVTAETITLDNNGTKAEYSLDVLPATSTTAGLMSAADKVKLDNSATSVSATTGNAIVTKSDGIYAESPAYTYMKQIGDFFYEIQINQDVMNLTEATAYFLRSTTNVNLGSCTGVYSKGKVLRQYDWYYDNEVEFLLRVAPDREKGTYGSIGVSSAIPFFTKDIVGSGKYYEQYKYLPYGTCDGVNEKGMYIQQNVTPVKSAAINVTHTCAEADYKGKITVNMIPRIVLDNCTTVSEALIELHKYDIVRPPRLPANYDAHYLVADLEGGHGIIEFSADGTTFNLHQYGMSEDAEIMTNFNCDISTGGITSDTFALDWYALSNDNEANAGLERWEICAAAINAGNVDLNELREKMIYTNMYTKSSASTFKWLTEYCGEPDPVDGGVLNPVKAKTSPDNFTSTYNQAISDYNARVRGDNKSWQSVHACIYDLYNKTINVVIQERINDIFEFKLDDNKVVVSDSNLVFADGCTDIGTSISFIGNLVVVSFAIQVGSAMVDENHAFVSNLPKATTQTWGAMIGNKSAGSSKFYIDTDGTQAIMNDALSANTKYVGTLIYIKH